MAKKRAPARIFLPAGAAWCVLVGLSGFNRERAGSGGGAASPPPPGACVFWAGPAPHFSVNARGSSHLTGGVQFEAVAAGFAEWSNPACTDLRPIDDGLTPRLDITVDVDAGAVSSRSNLVVFRPRLCSGADAGDCLGSTACDDVFDCLDDGDAEAIALTTVFARTDTGEILGAGTEFNDARYVFTTVEGRACDSACGDAGAEAGDAGGCLPLPPLTAVDWPCVQYDLQSIAAHEAGHFFGMAHTSVPGSVMVAVAAVGDLTKRHLGSDDVAGICGVYPADGPTATSCDGGDPEPAHGGGCAEGERAASPLGILPLAAVASALCRRRRPCGRRWPD